MGRTFHENHVTTAIQVTASVTEEELIPALNNVVPPSSSVPSKSVEPPLFYRAWCTLSSEKNHDPNEPLRGRLSCRRRNDTKLLFVLSPS
jgi:hypothetical protein